MDFISVLLGALLYGFVIWNIVYFIISKITRYKGDKLVKLITVFTISFIITLVIGWSWYAPALLFHAPIISLFFLYDFIKYKIKTKKVEETKEAPLN